MSGEQIKTREVARGCAECGQPLGPAFHVVDTALAVVDPDRARVQLGLEAMFGPTADPRLAEALGSDSVFEIHDDTRARRFVCQPCARKGITL